ncbi:GNAT family N-acetyltransferase [Zobellella denitrificans]|uniref:acetyl-CoA sensor PanZ family protein n=1 Tax=Zobellella denitrificans TaxID=347534 RepID=UPI000B8BE151|nr:acetyl-CoA sensor PanZ family protein [Zobellella denitrificans]OXS13790.1 GNAT family N-acetyltransferase [Zobellella denitrificans]
MRLTVHCLSRLPEQHRHHAELILQGRTPPDQAMLYLATFNDRAVALAWRREDTLEFIAVRDLTRRRGIGQELLRQVKQEAKAAGLTRLDCDPAQAPDGEREGLAAFLQGQGFRPREAVLSCCLYE